MSKQENFIQNNILEYLALSGVFAWRNNNTPVYDAKLGKYRSLPKWTIKGVPDILGILPDGRFFGIEVKTGKGVVSSSQKAFIERATKEGGLCFVAQSVDDVIKKLKGECKK